MSLNLDARQRAMLAEMGVAVWQPKGTESAAVQPVPGQAPLAAAQTPSRPGTSNAPMTPLAALTAAVQAEQGAAMQAGGQMDGDPADHAAQVHVPDQAAVQAPVAFTPTQSPASTVPTSSPELRAAPASSEPASHINSSAVVDHSTEKTGGSSSIPHANLPVSASDSSSEPVSSFSPVAQLAQAAVAPLMRAPSGPVADMDWPALRGAVQGCQACGLCHGRTQTVFGVGAERADWVVVGEAPGEQEDLRGEPFVGPAGQLLDAMLRAVGKDRQAPAGEQAVFIANVLKCRPPGNRNPAPDEIAQCEPYLRRQVELVQPKLILALGRFAVQTLLNTSEPIGRLRQQVHRYQGVPVIVSYHPAYLLRNLPDKAKAWADLVLAMRVANEGQ